MGKKIRQIGIVKPARNLYRNWPPLALLTPNFRVRPFKWFPDVNTALYIIYCRTKSSYGTFLQQLECGYEFPALIHVWIASAGVLEWFTSTSGEATSACKPF